MADLNELNPDIHDADSEQSGARVVHDKIYRLTRRQQEARGSGTSELAEPESKVGPDDRKPDARPSLNRLTPLRRPVPRRRKNHCGGH